MPRKQPWFKEEVAVLSFENKELRTSGCSDVGQLPCFCNIDTSKSGKVTLVVSPIKVLDRVGCAGLVGGTKVDRNLAVFWALCHIALQYQILCSAFPDCTIRVVLVVPDDQANLAEALEAVQRDVAFSDFSTFTAALLALDPQSPKHLDRVLAAKRKFVDKMRKDSLVAVAAALLLCVALQAASLWTGINGAVVLTESQVVHLTGPCAEMGVPGGAVVAAKEGKVVLQAANETIVVSVSASASEPVIVHGLQPDKSFGDNLFQELTLLAKTRSVGAVLETLTPTALAGHLQVVTTISMGMAYAAYGKARDFLRHNPLKKGYCALVGKGPFPAKAIAWACSGSPGAPAFTHASSKVVGLILGPENKSIMCPIVSVTQKNDTMYIVSRETTLGSAFPTQADTSNTSLADYVDTSDMQVTKEAGTRRVPHARNKDPTMIVMGRSSVLLDACQRTNVLNLADGVNVHKCDDLKRDYPIKFREANRMDIEPQTQMRNAMNHTDKVVRLVVQQLIGTAHALHDELGLDAERMLMSYYRLDSIVKLLYDAKADPPKCTDPKVAEMYNKIKENIGKLKKPEHLCFLPGSLHAYASAIDGLSWTLQQAVHELKSDYAKSLQAHHGQPFSMAPVRESRVYVNRNMVRVQNMAHRGPFLTVPEAVLSEEERRKRGIPRAFKILKSQRKHLSRQDSWFVATFKHMKVSAQFIGRGTIPVDKNGNPTHQLFLTIKDGKIVMHWVVSELDLGAVALKEAATFSRTWWYKALDPNSGREGLHVAALEIKFSSVPGAVSGEPAASSVQMSHRPSQMVRVKPTVEGGVTFTEKRGDLAWAARQVARGQVSVRFHSLFPALILD